MTIGKYHPSAQLAPFIREYLVIESDAEIVNQTIPDTALVLSFRFRGRILLNDGIEFSELPDTVIGGLRKSARSFRYEKGTGNLLAICREGAISAFTRMPAHEIFGLSIGTENLFPAHDLRQLMERLQEATSHTQRIALLEAFLIGQMTDTRQDELVLSATAAIRRENGQLRMKELAGSLHISQDAFEKRFRSLIGASPKQYAAIVRLRNLVRRHSDATSLTQAAYDAGYFDQSHFIRDFRQFTGQTPRAFFSGTRRW